MSSAIVLPLDALLSVIPARPGPRIIGLPDRVYPLPESVMEFIIVFSVRSFVFERFDAPPGKTRSSPVTGAVPPQFPATDHKPFVDPVQVLTAADAECMFPKKKNPAIKNIVESFKIFVSIFFILFF
jgi:hypothetical protein